MGSKHMSRRRLLKLMGLGAAVTTLAACQPKVVEVTKEVEKVVTQEVEKVVKEEVEVEKEVTRVVEKEAGPEQAEEEVTLVWDTFRGQPTDFKWNEERIMSFEEKFPNWKINFRPSPGTQQGMYGRYMTLIAAGDLGDLVSFDPGLYHLMRAVESDILLPLDDLMEADGLDLSEWFEVFIELQRYKGHIWGLPNWAWAGYDCLVTNKLHFEELGIELPEPDEPGPSLDTVAEWAHELYKEEEGGKRYGLAFAYFDHGLEPAVRTYGGNLINEEGTKCMLLEDEALEGMKWMYDLAVEDQVVPFGEQDLQQGSQQALAGGKLTMYQGGSLSMLNAAKAVTDETVAEVTQFLYPAHPDGGYTNAVRCGSWNVAQNTEHPWPAYEFTKHIAGREGTIGFNLFGGNGALSRPDVFPALIGANAKYAWFEKPLQDGRIIHRPANGRGPEYTDALRQYAQQLMDPYNPIPFEQGMQELHDAVQEILDMPMQ